MTQLKKELVVERAISRDEVYGMPLGQYLKELELAKLDKEIEILHTTLSKALEDDDNELVAEIYKVKTKKQNYKSRLKEWRL